MGSGSSHLADRRSKATKFKRQISSFICGSSSSRATAEMEDYPVELLVNSAGYSNSVPSNSQVLHKESALKSTEGIQFTTVKSEQGFLSDSNTLCSDDRYLDNSRRDNESASKGKRLTEGNEPAFSHRLQKESRSSQPGTSSASCSGEQSSRDVDSSMLFSGVDDLENDGSPESSTGERSSVRLPRQELSSLFMNTDRIEGHSDVQEGLVDSNSVVSPAVSSSNVGSWSHRNDGIHDGMPLGLGIIVSDRIQGSTEGNVLHVDITSVSSVNVSGITNRPSTREARRNSRRMFWDAFSTQNSRRPTDFPSILSTDDVDDMGYHRSWLLDFGSDILNDGMSDDLWHLGSRSRLAGERRLHPRSEFWGRLRGGAGERGGRIVCPSGLHPDGSCLCGLEDEASGQSSMSRIIMLAEALFEVLDELHRQPTSFGLSIFSNPAPESTVDSLPVKSYEKSTAIESGDDVEQCYICLEEYETGDKIRVLPCTHEYHMACVDKWLKEIHGVCPLCRGDVGLGTTEGSLPFSDGSSMPTDLVQKKKPFMQSYTEEIGGDGDQEIPYNCYQDKQSNNDFCLE
ncbi:hypothetical protein V2J09_010371 [Rumex salicifolius]